MSRTVRWISLELQGFGIWRDPVEVRFPERFGVLALPNERGKSTIVAGLCAVLYGLSADGIARRRSWGYDGPMRGGLDLSAGDRRIRIRRDLATHKTTIETLDDDGKPGAILFNANANPSGRKGSALEYPDMLREILGELADEDLFRGTFVVGQPVVPAGDLAGGLKKLITGFGRTTGDQARDTLFDEIKRLTCLTGDLGVLRSGTTRPTNQGKNGRIEEMMAEIERMSRGRDEMVKEIGCLHEIEDELAAAESARKRAEDEEKHTRADAEGLVLYFKQTTAREEALKARDEFRSAIESLEAQAEIAEKAGRRLAEEFADLADAPEEIEALVKDAEGIESRLDAARRDLHGIEADIETHTGPADETARWDLLPEGSDPAVWLSEVRASARQFTKAYARWEECARAHREAVGNRDRLTSIAVLPEGAQEELYRLPAVLAEIDEREREEEDAARRRGNLLDGIARRREVFERRWEPLAGVRPETFLPILEARSERHRRLATITAQVEESRGPAASAPGRSRGFLYAGIGLVAAALATIEMFALKAPAMVAILIGLVILAGVILLTTRKPRAIRDAARRIAEFEGEATRIRSQLGQQSIPSGPWLPDDEGSIDRARRAFRDMAEEEAQIAKDEAELGASGPAGDAAGTLRARRDRLTGLAREIEEATGLDAGEAVRAYRVAGRSLEEAVTALLDAECELFDGEAPASIASIPVSTLRSPHDRLDEAAPILGIDSATASDLKAHLDRLTDESWGTWAAEASARNERRAAAANAILLKERRDVDVRGLEEKRKELADRIGAGRIAASGGSLSSLAARISARADLIRERDAARHKSDTILAAARGGPYPDTEALAAAHRRFDDQRRDADYMIEKAIEASRLVQDCATADPSTQDRIRREATERAEAAATALSSANSSLSDAKGRMKAWRPTAPVNVAAIDIEIARGEASCGVLQKRLRAAVEAWKILGGAIEEFGSAHRGTLSQAIDGRFRTITGRENRRISLDTNLVVEIVDDGVRSGEIDLSQGAQDQLAICLRLAAADLIGGETILPLVLDDPFVHSDAERLTKIRLALETAARDRQIILLTQDERLREWGEPIRYDHSGR
jgi:chromosome segregation protein